MLEKMINFVYGALIFLILVGIAFSVYHIFWAKTPSIPEQNFDSVFSELNALKKDSSALKTDSCFDVVTRPYNEKYDLFLYPWKNIISECAGRPCLCLEQADIPNSCKILPDVVEDCAKGLCIPVMSSAEVSLGNRVQICNSGNKLSIKVL